MENSVASVIAYRIKAYHFADKLKLKDVREWLGRPTREFSNFEMVIEYGADSFAFFYGYGSVVFFNVPEELQTKELETLKPFRAVPEGLTPPSDPMSDTFSLEVQPGGTEADHRVFFDRLVVQELSFEKIKIACMLVGESSALEYYEILVDGLLDRATVFTKKLEREGRFLRNSQDLLKFIGLCMNTKQEIIANLYIVDSPEETWESPVLDKLFRELNTMLEIDTRYRALEYKIRVVQESVEIIVDLAKNRQSTRLELAIIFLIAFEIVLSLVRAH